MKSNREYFHWTFVGALGGFFIGMGLGPDSIHQGLESLNSVVGCNSVLHAVSEYYSILAQVELRTVPQLNFLETKMWRVVTGASVGCAMAPLGGLADLVELYVSNKKDNKKK